MPDDATRRPRATFGDDSGARRRAVALVTARLDAQSPKALWTRPLFVPLLEETVRDGVLDPHALGLLLFELTNVAATLADATATAVDEQPEHIVQAVALAMETC